MKIRGLDARESIVADRMLKAAMQCLESCRYEEGRKLVDTYCMFTRGYIFPAGLSSGAALADTTPDEATTGDVLAKSPE